MIKNLFKLLIFPMILLSFSSCTTELYEKNMIKAVGIDKTDEEYEVTVRYYPLDSDVSEEKNATAKGATVYDALNELSLITGKEQMYSKTSFVIIGNELAQDGIDDAIDFFIRYFRSRPTVNLYVSKTSASEILQTKVDDKLISSDTISSYTENSENAGKTVSSTIMDIISENLGTDETSILPLIEKKDNEIICNKSVVLKDYKSIFELSEEETKGFLMAHGEYIKGSLYIEDEKSNKISLELYVNDATLETVELNTNYSLNLNIKAEIAVVAIPLLDTDVSYTEIEDAVNEKVKALIENTVSTAHQNNIDILNLGYYLYINETAYWKAHSEDFTEKLVRGNININVESKITRIGEEEHPYY